MPVLKRQWPDCTVTWITHPASVPLLQNNPHIREVISSGPDALLQLAVRKFDIVIALDAGRTSASLASLARAKEKIGFVLHESGFATATSPAAEDWLRMGVFDDLKAANRRTYQEIMCSILGLPTAGMAYVVELSDKEITAARSRLEGMGIDCNKPIVGIHTGGGGRWRFKQWNEAGFRELIPQIVNEAGDDLQVLLFGGPLEREVNRAIREELDTTLFDAGCDNELREFAAIVKHCTVVLSGDSLAMHVALAVGSRVVVLFGPTSHAEIELFGQGEKAIPDLDCLVCYKEDCDFVPNCMDSISVDAVEQALLRQLKLAG